MIGECDLQFPIYTRPCFRPVAHSGETNVEPRYHYPRELFEDRDVFRVFILDGGAFFFTTEFLGGASGQDFLEAYRSGKLLAPWWDGQSLDWDNATRQLLDGAHLRMEQYAWLKRLYFMLPFAHNFFLTGSKESAAFWFLHFESWFQHTRCVDTTAAPDTPLWIVAWRRRLGRLVKPFGMMPFKRRTSGAQLNHAGALKLASQDMQLSWPLLVLIHSVFLLSSRPGLEDQNWNRVYSCIEELSGRLYHEAKLEMRLGLGKGNHFLHKGMALLFSGVLFPEFVGSQQLVELARRIIGFHARQETTKDGANIEMCPSYSHFMARLHLDATLLLEANKLPPIRNLYSTVLKEYHFLHQTESPEGSALPINESFRFDASHERKIVRHLVPSFGFPLQESRLFPDSSFAVLRNGSFTVYVDGHDADVRHHHEGKPNLLIYAARHEVLVDQGCCNYDRERARDGYSNAVAHNVVRLEPLSGGFQGEQKGAGKVRLFDFDCKKSTKSISMSRHATTGGIRYRWERDVMIAGNEIEIRDRIESKKVARIILVFHFPGSSTVTIRPNGSSRAINPNWELVMTQEASCAYARTCADSPIFGESRGPVCREFRTSAEGKNIQFRTVMHFQQRMHALANEAKVQIG